ncbi:motility associated factor glycosyltransferase family protein [Campylobacter sp. MIT 21-1685]|uniref:motility associated factor glycosyltransferase family protein n=1 Tax=unclassified Campylobacter TaxID=2593542 RepID=UPI00224AAE13|nr:MULTISPECIES: motility associated factor glycosyltransferase family protein [unclassified Campylobacter]MCX2752019.1 motility associated factor glycosyltransferase family protein [Campylobacter sp. MIT 21-1682]MCX2808199.1 motility associated factor glycosyltransferase family protein [Campylobacter sp. MIT 21-1685]
MNFNAMQKDIFEKNLNSLKDLKLKEVFLQIQDTKFELLLGQDSLDINLKNTNGGGCLYKNTLKELDCLLAKYNENYPLYPVLYFYGFGNGILFKALLQNQNHKHFIVFENDLEIPWLIFHLLDFSTELQNDRLILLNTNTLTQEHFHILCHSTLSFQFSRLYFLELTSDYYEQFKDDVLQVNKNLIENFKEAISHNGNDPLDSLQGIEQFVFNLPIMITNPCYEDLIHKRKNLSQTAIIVSTGPSLTKQLPLLKKYAKKALIICADSAYSILAKNNIAPDYVCMLERAELTAEFFNHDFGDFDKDITFICATFIHPNAIKYLQEKKRKIILTMKPLNFALYCGLKNKFGFGTQGYSVAHMNYVLAANLGCKNIILIGQDLAYADNGDSHPSDYQNKANYETDIYKHTQVLAYGGKGLVKTHIIWLLFKTYFETLITKHSYIKTYNATEGGLRIEGTIEKPFEELCNTLLVQDISKPFAQINPLDKEKQNEFLLKAYARIYKSIFHCEELELIFTKEYNEFNSLYSELSHLELDKALDAANTLIERIDTLKTQFENFKNMQDIYEIFQPFLTQFELNLAKIFVLVPKTPEDAFNKSSLWIKEHLNFIQMAYAHINAQKKALLKNINPLENELQARKLDKYKQKIQTKKANDETYSH